jgi:hypothetical protein
MRNKLIYITLCCIIASCSASNISIEISKTDNGSSTKTNDGLSYEKAIIITEKTEQKGVDAEYTWLRQHYPGYHTNGQSLNFFGKKPYDIITITTADGKELKIYFDISNFYGKL